MLSNVRGLECLPQSLNTESFGYRKLSARWNPKTWRESRLTLFTNPVVASTVLNILNLTQYRCNDWNSGYTAVCCVSLQQNILDLIFPINIHICHY